MTGAAILTLLATVLAVDEHRLQLDKGLLDGLRVGDEGRVTYELRVGTETRTIEVARGVVVRVEATGAELEIEDAREIHTGYQVRFEIPAERTRPEVVLQRIALISGDPDRRAALRLWADRALPREPRLEAALLEVLWSRVADRDSPPAGGAGGDLVRVEGGVYRIGADPPEATHYDQQPAFRAHLAPFWIDRSVPEAAAGASYAEAEALCRARGMRLPTELEWEVAATSTQSFELPRLYEWTASWYLPYPGNDYPEEAYGRTYRVLRGSPAGVAGTLRSRRFAEPDSKIDTLGFRCATSVAPLTASDAP